MSGAAAHARVGDARVLQPGRNCWRLAHAARVAVLIDGEAYFSAVAEAIARARHAIFILGWDFNSLVRLHPERGRTATDDHIAAVLSAALERQPGLEVYVLDWDFAMIYALEREVLPELRLAWSTPPRFHFRLDGHHPAGGAHHQKIVVVDDALGLVGGFDFGSGRWDTPEHRPDDARRIDPWGHPYPPLHDVQLAVDGEAAAALGELARARWQAATGERVPPAPSGLDPWPAGVVPDVHDVDVAIARTMPAFAQTPEVREVEALHCAALAAAQRWIYIENQYFTSSAIGAVLERRLREADGPEVVIVLPRQCQGWLEETTMGVLRARLMRRLRAADVHGRLRLCYPEVAGLGERRLTVHSKVVVIDEWLLRVGSANLNNRSMGLDTECDLALEAAGDARVGAAIARVRDRLLGEHLGHAPDRVAAELAARGSLIAVIDALGRPERRLVPFDGEVGAWLDCVVPDAALVDPERPISADALLAQLVPGGFELAAPRRRRMPWLLGMLACAVLTVMLALLITLP